MSSAKSKTEWIEVPALAVHQPIGTFFLCAMDSSDVVAVSYADVRRIEGRDLERVVGIQRPLVPSRVKELKKYVTTIDSAFPTSILLAVGAADAIYDAEAGRLRLRRDANVAKIIDGQHRIAGLEGYSGADPFELTVTVFVDIGLEDQALLFATINLKQTRVGKSLAYDLTEYFRTRSPQKTLHDIARLLNSKEESPFRNKIKILGTAEGPEETITQAAFIEALLPYLSDDPMMDRDKLKRGHRLSRVTEEDQILIFRNLFIDERDAEIAKIIFNYFAAVNERWPEAWQQVSRGNVLNRTTGLLALTRFLRDAYVSFNAPGSIVTQEQFASLFERVGLKDSDFNPDRFKPGGSGQKDLYQAFADHAQFDLFGDDVPAGAS